MNRGGKRENAGRHPISGENRAPAGLRITPTALARLKAAAAREGVSANELVERWAMSLTTAGSPPHSTATTDTPRSPGARDR